MVGKVIKKTYKYRIPDPSEIFRAFKEKFSTAALSSTSPFYLTAIYEEKKHS